MMLAPHRAVVVAVGTFVFVYLLFQSLPSGVSSFHDLPRISHIYSKPSVRETILALFDGIRHPITDNYTDPSGKEYILEGPPLWTKPLRKKILLVDIDTREPSGERQILNSTTIDWEKLEMDGGQLVSNGIMNHYLYAQIHGYDYKFFQASHIEGHYDTWISPHVLHSLLPDYQFVVTMDADVTISHLEVPLEWLFNKWNITKNTSISLPWDQAEVQDNVTLSVDSKGLQVLNTGFMAVQNLEYTYEMLQAWKECTSETRYEGCGRWKEEWSHEQRAFSEYIRYDFNPAGDNIMPIPCDDAMGWPGMINDYQGRITTDCNGNFFRHHTLRKDMAKTSSASSVMQALSEILQKTLLEQQEKLWVKEADLNKTKEVVDTKLTRYPG